MAIRVGNNQKDVVSGSYLLLFIFYPYQTRLNIRLSVYKLSTKSLILLYKAFNKDEIKLLNKIRRTPKCKGKAIRI